MTGCVERAFTVVGEDDHTTFIGRVAAGDEELGLSWPQHVMIGRCLVVERYHIADILPAALKSALLALVVNPNE